MSVKTYIYPQNLKARAHLWLWSLRDFLIMSISFLMSAVIFVETKLLLPAAVSLCFGFLTIRLEETTVMDYLSLAVRYFLTTQQYYEWR